MRALTWWLVIVGCGLVLAVPPARSEPAKAIPGESDRVDVVMGRYSLNPAFATLGRGLSNILGGWLEIPLNIHRHYSTPEQFAPILPTLDSFQDKQRTHLPG